MKGLFLQTVSDKVGNFCFCFSGETEKETKRQKLKSHTWNTFWKKYLRPRDFFLKNLGSKTLKKLASSQDKKNFVSWSFIRFCQFSSLRLLFEGNNQQLSYFLEFVTNSSLLLDKSLVTSWLYNFLIFGICFWFDPTLTYLQLELYYLQQVK